MDDGQAIALDNIDVLRNFLTKNSSQSSEIIKELQHQTRALASAIERQTDRIAMQQLSDKTVEFPYEGKLIKLYIPLGDYDYIQRHIQRHRTFYEESLLRLIRDTYDLRGKIIFDIGANIGNHMVYFGALCGAAKCVSFEPNPYAASIARRNLEINQLGNVELVQIALSDREGALRFDKYVPHNLGATSFAEAVDGDIPAVRLDEFDMGPVDFMKIDVEGMAAKVLDGARETIARYRPGIMIEFFGDEHDEVMKHMNELGYELICAAGAGNHLFRHKG